MVGGAISIAIALIGLATLGVFLGSGNTSGILKSIFDGFTGALNAAVGASKG